jgi:hypothetical protein
MNIFFGKYEKLYKISLILRFQLFQKMDTFPSEFIANPRVFRDFPFIGGKFQNYPIARSGYSSITYENSIDRDFRLGEIGGNWGKLEPFVARTS